jgi:hypothetical protein
MQTFNRANQMRKSWLDVALAEAATCGASFPGNCAREIQCVGRFVEPLASELPLKIGSHIEPK